MTDDALKTLLTDAVSAVDPEHRLGEIRARTARPRRGRWYAAGAVLATAAAVAAVAVVATTAGDRGAPGPADQSHSAAPSQESDPTGPGTVAVPVYYVGDTPAGPRLFREWRRARIDEQLERPFELMAGAPLDPDYRTFWPSGWTDWHVGVDGFGDHGSFSIALPDARWSVRPDDLTAEEARLAVQQLVHTLQGTGQTQYPVHVYLGTREVPLLGVKTTGGLTRDRQLDVLSPVNVSDPADGSEVEDVFTARGVAASFEANVPWEVRAEDGRVLLEGFATAEGCCDRLYPWETEVDVSSLEPGTYTFAARTDDPSGGAEGFGATEDTRTIVVR